MLQVNLFVMQYRLALFCDFKGVSACLYWTVVAMTDAQSLRPFAQHVEQFLDGSVEEAEAVSDAALV